MTKGSENVLSKLLSNKKIIVNMDQEKKSKIINSIKDVFASEDVVYNDNPVMSDGHEFRVNIGKDKTRRIYNFINNQSGMRGWPTSRYDGNGFYIWIFFLL